MDKIIISLAQTSACEDLDSGFNKVYGCVKKSAGSDLLLFPEIQCTRFFPQYPEPILYKKTGKEKEAYSVCADDLRIKKLPELCKEYGIYVFPNFYLKCKEGYYDSSLLIDKTGRVIGRADMVHVINAENFYEKDYYLPSKTGFRVFDTDFGKVGIVICFDRHFPESVRACAKEGARLILVPAANVYGEPLNLFECEIRAQAFNNGVFIAVCNRVGREDAMHFAGQSFIASPDGEILLKLKDKEEIAKIEIDLSESEKNKELRPYIKNLRPEFY